MGLLEERLNFKPFEYDWAFQAWQTQQRVHWLAEEIPLAEDVKDWNHSLTPEEKNLLTQIFRFFTQADLDVNSAYMKHYSQIFKPPEILMMLSVFSAMETTHVVAYSYLLDTVGMPEAEYSAFLAYKEMKDKHDYMHNFNISSKYEIAKTLAAFGAFTEGLQLFASFAMLLNFPRFNKMKGMGQIITWSVRDECYAEGTEILTPRGWIDFANLIDEDKVAQWDMKTGQVSFVCPTKRVEYDVDKELVEFSAEAKALGLLVTPEHDVVYVSDEGQPGARKIWAADFVPHARRKIPVSGRKAHGRNRMTPLERFRVAFAADGSLPGNTNGESSLYRHTGKLAGYLRVYIHIKKDRKIDRLHRVLHEAGLEYDCIPKDGQTLFRINAPIDISKKLSDWIRLDDVSASWCDDFFEELIHWDGHDRYGDGSMNVFGTVKIEDADLVQALCAISGRSSKHMVSVDPRGYQDYHRLSIKQRTSIRTGGLKKRRVPYTGKVRCVEVPSGAVVVRYKNNVQISGNTLHVENVIRLFRTFLHENPELDSPKLKREIYEICDTIVQHENAFIDLAFELGPIEGLTSGETKEYIKYIADRRLTQLGYDPMYHIDKNPLPWLDDMLNALEFSNFFETKSTEYSKAATQGSWEEAFS